jgi:hypothetical protein
MVFRIPAVGSEHANRALRDARIRLDGRFVLVFVVRRRWLETTESEVLIVGHTHAPGVIEDIGGGMIINPGALAREGIHLPLVTFDSSDGAAEGKKTAPRGTFGVLDLPEKRFTVHMAADGTEVRLATAKTGVVDRRGSSPATR